MGAHPSAPSEVETEAGPVTLLEWIARDPVAVLGADVAERFGAELPFLFKVLAPARALSIQTHPNAAQARAGFARENAAGIALDSPLRNYRDANPKPELICALSEFTALCGFRRVDAIVAGLASLELPGLVAELEALRVAGDAGLEGFFRGLMERPADARRALADDAAEAAGRRAGGAPEYAEMQQLAQQFPGDVGVLAPLLLNLVQLAPGQALFLDAGNLHAYLRGVGVELMANSDNVLRGGLTTKHVDVPELLATLRFHAGPPNVLQPGRGGAYATAAQAFELLVLRSAAGTPRRVAERRSVEILLCTEGRLRIAAERAGDVLELVPGQAVLASAAAGAYRVEGAGVVYRAGVPR
jgi:mannose-6-phosphate isomerase